ncbi:MAG TPA: hypothetical protein VMU89_07850 [Thermomicrobiaceae bacterium]|nr:hypothetical protein [Thermomicrobiaceae bacterium]
MVGLIPVVTFLAIFMGVGMSTREFDGRVRRRLLLGIVVLVGLLFALGLR